MMLPCLCFTTGKIRTNTAPMRYGHLLFECFRSRLLGTPASFLCGSHLGALWVPIFHAKLIGAEKAPEDRQLLRITCWMTGSGI